MGHGENGSRIRGGKKAWSVHANWEGGTDIYIDGAWEEGGPNPGQWSLHYWTPMPIWKFSWVKVLRGFQRPRIWRMGWVFFPGRMEWDLDEPNADAYADEEPNADTGEPNADTEEPYADTTGEPNASRTSRRRRGRRGRSRQ